MRVGRSPSRHLHGHFVFVVVLGEVGTDTHEHGQVLVVERLVVVGGFGVDEHLQVFVLPQVEVGGFVDGPTIAIDEVLDGHLQRLLIDTGGLRHADHTFLLDAGRDDVRHRVAAAVLVDADGRDVEGRIVVDVVGFIFARGLDALRVGAPFAFHEVEGGETQHDGFLEVGQEHSHETDGREVVDVADDLVGLSHRDAELIPGAAAHGAVGQGRRGMEDVSDMVLADDHLGRVEFDDILVVALRLAQGVVAVDVFGVGQGGVAVLVAVGLLDVGRRVAVGAVELLITGQDTSVLFVFGGIPISGAEVVVVVARRVVVGVDISGRVLTETVSDGVEVGVLEEGAFVHVAQTVVTHVLVLAGFR